MATPPNIRQKAQYWARCPLFDEATRKEVEDLIQKQDEKGLAERFESDLKFGTAGLRGVLGSGSSRMNLYNVRKATHAVGLYLKELHGKKPLKVAVSFDCRHFSKEFAVAVVEVLAAQKIETFLTEKLGPAPLLSFMVRELKCDMGIYITASHNPPQYNGFKVYLPTGGQIVPPHDEQITRYYSSTEYDAIQFHPFEEVLNTHRVTIIGEEFITKYLDRLQKSLFTRPSESLSVVYTSLHGTGLRVLPEAFSRFGFSDLHIVEAQSAYDGNFPTVKSPNPGEAQSLVLAIEEAKRVKADIVLATDPDADRLGVAVAGPGGYEAVEGNALGSLMIDFILSQAKEAGTLPENPLVIKTIVTTEMQRSIAALYGVEVEETLTGFKWIAERIEDYESGARKPPRKYVCGGEEAYGFLFDSFIRDKDGISACVIAAQMAAYHKSRGKTLFQALDELYVQHGFYLEELQTVVSEGMRGEKAMARFIQSLRDNVPATIAGLPVVKVRDFLLRRESVFPEGLSLELDSPKSDVLQFYLGDRARLSIRPSGTEPLMKYYLSVREPAASAAALPKAKEEAAVLARAIFEWLNTYGEPFLS